VKRLIISITTVFLLASFVPFQTAEASSSYTTTEKLVIQAEKLAGALKWQISVEYNKKLTLPDMKLFNQTKEAYQKANQSVVNLKHSKKPVLQKRLKDNVKLHIDRSVAYIDAINGGKKIESLTNELNYLINEEIYMIRMDDLYHELSYQVRKQAILIYRVYGKSTRDAILAKYKTPAENQLKMVAYFVTVKDLVDAARVEVAKDEVDIYLAIDYLAKANEFLPRINNPEHPMRALQSDIISISAELSEISEPYFEGPMIEWLNTEDGFKESLLVIFDMEEYLQEEAYLLDEPIKYEETRIISFEFEGYEYTVLLYKNDPEEWVSPRFYILDISEWIE
jgi:hypothetical protein